jgi:vacuolar-type H+-ATPase subunit E/Vma4
LSLPLPDLLAALRRSNEEEITKLLSAARGEADTLLAAARAEAAERLGRTLDVERAGLRQTSERRRVAARRAAAARVLRARAALLDRVVQAALGRAALVLGWPEYASALEASVRQVRELLGDDPGELRCAPADADRVRGWASGSALDVLASSEVPAGLHCTADDGRLTVDLTLPARVLREAPALAIAVAPSLEAGE